MPPNEKSYIITATCQGLGMSRVPLSATARSHRTISSSGKPIPSATARNRSNRRRRRRRVAPSAAGRAMAAGPASAAACSSRTAIALLVAQADHLGDIGQLADLLLLEHQLAI